MIGLGVLVDTVESLDEAIVLLSNTILFTDPDAPEAKDMMILAQYLMTVFESLYYVARLNAA